MNLYFKALFCLALLNSAVFGMDDEIDFESYQDKAKLVLLDNSSNPIQGTDFFQLPGFPDEMIILIFKKLELKELRIVSRTSTRAQEFFNKNTVQRLLVGPKVQLIAQNINFRFRELDYLAGNFDRKPAPSLSWPIIEDLCAASSFGNGDASLMLAEMDWSIGDLCGKKFVRYGLYYRALESKIPGSEKKRFAEDQDEYCAIFLGIAHDAISSVAQADKKKFDKLERAVNAFLCINDATFFQLGSIAMVLSHKLWFGDYERLEADSSGIYRQRVRTIEEKGRDFLVFSKLFRHAKQLGLQNPGMSFGNFERDLHNPAMGGAMFHQFEFVLSNEKQAELFVNKGRALCMPD